MIPLEEFTDNDVVAYEVPIANVYWKHKPGDVTAPLTKTEKVTYRQVREMFIKFVRDARQLHDKPRDEQIREFNLQRREAREPKIPADILEDVLV